jgi:cupin-like protein
MATGGIASANLVPKLAGATINLARPSGAYESAIAMSTEQEVETLQQDDAQDGRAVLHEPLDCGSAKPPEVSAEWRLWMAESRLVGVSDEQITSTMVQSGFDPLVAAVAMDALRGDPFYLAADRIAQRFKKLRSILDIRRSLTNLSCPADSIERRSSISQSEFLERYYAVNRPVILTGLLTGSGVCTRWTPEYLAEVCGDAIVQIMAGRQSDLRYEVNSESHKRAVKMSEYVRMVRDGGESNDYYLVANNGFFDLPETQALFSEIPQLSEYLDAANAKRRVFFWFGPAGTVTPLHHDVMNILVAQISGRKRFTLIAPEQTPFVYNEVGVYGEVNCGEPDDSRHPLYRQATPIDVTIGPGDVLFIPVGWWHYVRALDVSIMLSYVNFRFPNSYEWFHPSIG